MFCRFCGKEILDDATICIHCGCQVQAMKIEEKETASTVNNTNELAKMNILALVGFISSIISLFVSLFGLIAVAGLILSIIGLKQIKENKAVSKGQGLAIAGIIVSIISIIYAVYTILVLIAVIGAVI